MREGDSPHAVLHHQVALVDVGVAVRPADHVRLLVAVVLAGGLPRVEPAQEEAMMDQQYLGQGLTMTESRAKSTCSLPSPLSQHRPRSSVSAAHSRS